MPKRLIAMKIFMKERLLILTILDISHKIAEFIALAVTDYDAKKQYILDGVAQICAKYPLYE